MDTGCIEEGSLTGDDGDDEFSVHYSCGQM